MAKTLSFKMTIGVNEGYGHNNEAQNPVKTVATEWQKIAAEHFSETGRYVSAVLSPSTVVYHTQWGCPEGGETTVDISGSANPEFVFNIEEWRLDVLKITKELKKVLKQSTLVVEFHEVEDFHYLK